jgi:hypothetical protein
MAALMACSRWAWVGKRVARTAALGSVAPGRFFSLAGIWLRLRGG